MCDPGGIVRDCAQGDEKDVLVMVAGEVVVLSTGFTVFKVLHAQVQGVDSHILQLPETGVNGGRIRLGDSHGSPVNGKKGILTRLAHSCALPGIITGAGAARGYCSDAVQEGPVLAGYPDCVVVAVVGDAIENIRIRSPCAGWQKPRKVEAALHRARLRIDDDDVVGLPDIGPDTTVYPLEFIEPCLRSAVSGHGHGFFDVEGLRIEKSQRSRSIAVNELITVVGQAPAFPRQTEAPEKPQIIDAIHQAKPGAPGKLVDPVIELGYALAEQARVKRLLINQCHVVKRVAP